MGQTGQNAHVNPAEAETMLRWGGVACSGEFSGPSCEQLCVIYLGGDGSVLTGAVFCWVTVGPGVHKDVTLCISGYLMLWLFGVSSLFM